MADPNHTELYKAVLAKAREAGLTEKEIDTLVQGQVRHATLEEVEDEQRTEEV